MQYFKIEREFPSTNKARCRTNGYNATKVQIQHLRISAAAIDNHFKVLTPTHRMVVDYAVAHAGVQRIRFNTGGGGVEAHSAALRPNEMEQNCTDVLIIRLKMSLN